jgi:hypothetical protein
MGVAFRDDSGRLQYVDWDPVSGPTNPETVAVNCCDGYSMSVDEGALSIAFATTSGVARVVSTTNRGTTWSRSRR